MPEQHQDMLRLGYVATLVSTVPTTVPTAANLDRFVKESHFNFCTNLDHGLDTVKISTGIENILLKNAVFRRKYVLKCDCYLDPNWSQIESRAKTI